MGGGVNDFGIQRAWGVMRFGISEGNGGLKYGSRLSLCTDIFWNCPMPLPKSRLPDIMMVILPLL